MRDGPKGLLLVSLFSFFLSPFRVCKHQFRTFSLCWSPISLYPLPIRTDLSSSSSPLKPSIRAASTARQENAPPGMAFAEDPPERKSTFATAISQIGKCRV